MNPETLPPYNPDAKCAGCGSDDVSIGYYDGVPPLKDEPRTTKRCNTCGRTWYEAPPPERAQ